ncbi:MAG TPA: metallophosphoesterase family protein [Chthoniobacterales bacterium]|nr:metallophosphoesterase family protein [Chthoniobacterales bacterium]
MAALYDIHGNLPALEAVLAEIADLAIERIVVGGDVVPGPMPKKTLDRLLDLDIPVQFITGNGEVAVLAEMQGSDPGVPSRYREAIKWNAAQLTPHHRDLLQNWPGTLRMHVPRLGKVLFCHATPQNPNDIVTRLTPDDRMASIFGDAGADVFICGHTHMQFDRTIGSVRIVNAGSVGMPFGEPGACWLALEPQVRLRRTRYDLETAATRIRQTQYPEAREFAARNVLAPPSEETMLRAYAPKES